MQDRGFVSKTTLYAVFVKAALEFRPSYTLSYVLFLLPCNMIALVVGSWVAATIQHPFYLLQARVKCKHSEFQAETCAVSHGTGRFVYFFAFARRTVLIYLCRFALGRARLFTNGTRLFSFAGNRLCQYLYRDFPSKNKHDAFVNITCTIARF